MSNNNALVIMAGGVGSRFWPMSTTDNPKQFIDVLGVGRTMLQLTVDRFKAYIPTQNMWVMTSELYGKTVAEQLPEIPLSHILLEPCRRNTAPCVAYVAWRIKSENPKANIVVAPSDHLVLNGKEFERVIQNALSFTAETDAIVTLGMKPTRPETGYGYIEADLSIPSARNKELFRVDSFREKPDLATAQRYIKRHNYFWNAGIFIGSVSTFINAYRIYQPAMSKLFEGLLPYYGTDKEQEKINAVYPQCENISIDYAIMERAEEIFIQPADFGWSDLGTWGSLHENSTKDPSNNVLIGENIHMFESANCIVHTSEGCESGCEYAEKVLRCYL
ncbi:MAG: mannose-1-phosphate guanylyltransferase, partial [Bacteroidaceae bacterium]|nr:mannose-1-phosphate guanylyltransferase [Bacteroidaceae bacterium]